MLWNIIDRRKHNHRWQAVTAIIEPTANDNSVADSDQAEEPTDESWVYDQREKLSVAEAVAWTQSLPFQATLYLYDFGEGIR